MKRDLEPELQLQEVADTEGANRRCKHCGKWRRMVLMREGKTFVPSSTCFSCLELGAELE
jgi:hypothetical protein